MLEIKIPAHAHETILKFIKDFVKEKSVVVGVSGGLDSSVVLKLCVEALGSDRVLAVHMPDKITPSGDTEDVKFLTRGLNVELRIIPIDDIVENLEKKLKIKEEKVIANLKARVRMLILYSIANKEGRLVGGTSNKSEILVGYFTKYGDGASDFAPIGDLYKTQVRILAKEIGVPIRIIEKKPSANLLPGQYDEDEMGINYDLLDKILYGMELGMNEEEISLYANADLNVVKKVFEMHRNSRHKRVILYIPKIGARTVNTDWRE